MSVSPVPSVSLASNTPKCKRKDPHPVRKEFLATSESHTKCLHCGWSTRINATRMVKHIITHCQQVPPGVRRHIAAIQMAAEEKERDSWIISENKKDIHALFHSDENKRTCMFCGWSTVRNLTRMRTHIVLHCTKVPDKVRNCFIKNQSVVQAENTFQQSFKLVIDNSNSSDTDVKIVNSTDLPDEDEETEVQESYVEVQELHERNCTWCGKLLNYDSCEVQDGIEVFCSTWCYENHIEDEAERLGGKPQSTSVATAGASTPQKRPLSPVDKSEEPELKQVKLVVASSSNSVKEDKTEGGEKSPFFVEIASLSPHHSNDSTPQSSPRSSASCKNNPNETQAARLSRSGPNSSFVVNQTTPSQKDKATATDEGSCHSFAGGHVYPQEDVRSADHKLQWTKAVISRPAPQFEATAVVDGAFKKIKLSDYRGKYLVFFFYPLDFTFVCPTEILAFSDRVSEFRKLNTEVIAASIDSHFTHLAWINTPRKEGGLGKIGIPLVSDITHSIAKDYGVYLDDLGHTLRGLFIIDDRGILRQITMNDLPVGRSVDETLRLVQAFQYTDKHGEVCPAGWKPGQDTIVPNPEEKIKYFEKNH